MPRLYDLVDGNDEMLEGHWQTDELERHTDIQEAELIQVAQLEVGERFLLSGGASPVVYVRRVS